jgi:hypothetical protein
MFIYVKLISLWTDVALQPDAWRFQGWFDIYRVLTDAATRYITSKCIEQGEQSSKRAI